MANLDWPAGLNQIQPTNVSFSDLQEAQTDEQSSGNRKINYVLASNLNVPNKMTVAFEFSPEQYQVFDTFYKNETKSGVLFYNWHHPLLGGRIEARIVGGIGLQQVGLNFQIEINLEYFDR